jgi:ABC-type spermidine/putrescine transport system permease subunit II
VSASLKGYAPTFEMAAMSLGANWWNTFRHVTFPMIRSGMYGGAILAFATSFDELMLSLFLTGATTRTLPRLIWEHMNDFLTPAIAAVAVLVLAFTLLLFVLAAFARRDHPEAAHA